MADIKARYDQLIDTPIKDRDGNIVGRKRHHHFVFGKLGSPISGGFYVKEGTPIPDMLSISVPDLKEEESNG